MPLIRIVGAVAALCGVAGACAKSTSPVATSGAISVAVASPGTILKCLTVQLNATVTTAGGVVVSPDSETWTSSDNSFATVTSSGAVHTLRATPHVTIQVTAYRGTYNGIASTTFDIVETSSAACP